MDFGRPDYTASITVPDAPQQEPGLLLRGQDPLAAITVEIYAVLAEADGLWEIARHARAQAEKMRAWPTKKRPDLPTIFPPTIRDITT